MSDIIRNVIKQLRDQRTTIGHEMREIDAKLKAKEAEYDELTVALDKLTSEEPKPLPTYEEATEQEHKVAIRKPGKVTDEAVRDWLTDKRRWTIPAMMAHFERSESWAYQKMTLFVEKGLVTRTESLKNGHKSWIYEYVPPPPTPNRVKSTGEHTAGNGNGGSLPVAGTGQGRIHTDKDYATLLDKAIRQGYTVRKDGKGHQRVSGKGGWCSVASTSGDPKTLELTKSKLRAIGVKL